MKPLASPWLRPWLRRVVFNHVPGMITCRELERFVADYMAGTLPSAQRYVFMLHLLACRECRDYLRSYRRAIEIGRAVFIERDAPPPPDVPEVFIEAVLDARLQGGGRGRSRPERVKPR
ncbi:MAG: anti-sigma factor family protein [Methyloligellaceae bacterium]